MRRRHNNAAMAKVLVIPDTHLKPKIFDLADKIMRDHEVDYAVQLGDNLDDFYCRDDQYRRHYTRMVAFYCEHPETIWLWGNHEASYILNRPVTGNIYAGKEYAQLYQKNFRPRFVHLDGKVVFSHAGIFQEFIDNNNLSGCKTAIELIDGINKLELLAFWCDDSPLWARSQYDELTPPGVLNGCLQIVGHTPLGSITKIDEVVSTDIFSTNWGKRVGDEKMIIVDTDEPSFEIVDIDFRREFGEER